jgi:hypothetical protein
MNKPSNTTNDVTNIYFKTTIVSAFFMRPSSGLGYKGRMFKKLVNYNFVGSAGSRYKSGISIHRYIV